MKNEISKSEVSEFKNKWCNENGIIAGIIREKLIDYFDEPILDLGAGLGDIAYNSLYDKRVLLVDLNKVTEEDYPLSVNHTRHEIDFFEFSPTEKIGTLFICHSLQFIDDDIDFLNRKVNGLSPKNLILVTNKNDDFMGDLITWAELNCEHSNPEINHPNFPSPGFKLEKEVNFRASLSCDTFEELSDQISYLMLIELTSYNRNKLISFLKTRLSTPSFTFSQQIRIFKNHETR